MLKYVIRRLLLGVPVLLAIIVVTFGLIHNLPGGPFDRSGEVRMPTHIRAQLEQKFGLSKPVFFNLPSDGLGSETAWGETVTVKGHSDTGYTEQIFPEPENAGIRLYGEYHLIDNGADSCVGQASEPGWALISRREVCVVTGGDASQTLTEVETNWSIDLFDAQFWSYIGNVLQFDFGPQLGDVQENRQVIDEFRERVPVSLQLGIFSTMLGFSLGIPLGVIAAVYHNSPVDYLATFVAVIGQAMPAIVLAPVLILIFAVQLDLVPVTDPLIWRQGSGIIWPYVRAVLLTLFLLFLIPGLLRRLFGKNREPYSIPNMLFLVGLLLASVVGAVSLIGEWFDLAGSTDDFDGVLSDYVSALILPVFTIGTGMSAGIARLTRATLLQVLNDDFIRTARAKGMRERTVIYIHALKNSLIPVVTGVGGLLAGIVSGSFVVELIFAIPGMGDVFLIAVDARDYTTIMGTTIFFSAVLILGNILVDIMYTWLDPRIRFD